MSGQDYDATFFEGQAERSLASARTILGRVFPMLQPRRVLDVGCGVGTWLRAALDLGAAEIVGTDGTYVDPAALLIERDRFIPADLATQSLPEILGSAAAPFDLVVCMEVAEHLPHARGPSLVAELAALGDVVLFSAAVPFQYGTSHVNEQWPEYWATLFRGQGFECFDPLRAELWNDPGVEWWYAQNVLLFARTGSAAAAALPAASHVGRRGLSLVHPDNLLSNLLGLPRRYRQHASQEESADLHAVVEANRRGDLAPPVLAAPARAAVAPLDARDVFPWTRTEIYQPEQRIAALEQEAADLARQLGESGAWLQAAGAAFAAERNALAAERKARLLAEEQAHDARHWRDQTQAHAAARLVAEAGLADAAEREDERKRGLDESRAALAAEAQAQREQAQAEREQAHAEHEQAHGELLAFKAHLDVQAAQLAARSTELDAQAAHIEVVRRSRVWRASRRVQRVGGRIAMRLRNAAPAPPDERAVEPEPAALVPEAPETSATDLSLETSTAVEAATPLEPEVQPPPDKPQIKKFEKLIGDVNWWTLAGAVTRLKRLEVFDGEDYLRRNADVAAIGMDPYAHFIQAGALEGRSRIDPEDLARLMGGLALFDHAVRALPPKLQDDGDLPSLVADVGHIGIFVSTHGNVFMEDLADDLAADLRAAGVQVDVLDETSDIETRPPTCLFIAPHEFFTLGRGTDWVRDDVLSQGFMFGTEQVQTTWFNLSLPFILMSRGMLDICTQTASLFERLDMAALHVLPGARTQPHVLTERDRRHPLYGVLPPAARGRSTSRSSARPALGATGSSPATPRSSRTTRPSTTAAAPDAAPSAAKARTAR